MKFLKNLFRKKTKKTEIKITYYKSLDTLPIGRWWFLLDTQDLRALLKSEDFEDAELTEAESNLLLHTYNELIYTVNEIDLTIEKLRAKIAAYHCEYEIFGKKSAFNEAKRLEYHLNVELKKKSNIDLSKLKSYRLKEIAALERYFQRNIDIWKVATNLYYQYVTDYNNYIENLNKKK